MPRPARYLIAADTGGTFTDLAVYDTATNETRFGKTLTTYGDLTTGVIEGLQDAGTELSGAQLLKHGTTHVVNAFIQRSGCRVALVTTEGFRDVLHIARGSRPVPFDLRYRREPPVVSRDLCFELPERVSGDGTVLRPLEAAALEALAPRLQAAEVEAIAISFLNAYRNPCHEERAKTLLQKLLPGVFITTGTELSQEWSEYERASTAAANAYVGARMDTYIRGFETRLRERQFPGALYMMGSNGGVMSASHAASHPVALLESGPVGGCIGASAYARALGLDKLIAFDMGGTTAKCALVEKGRFEVQTTYYVGGYERGFPVRTPVLDIVEVGAGGGSIGWLDPNGRLRMGPRSAGSDPGPICFRRGGREPTITDANLVLGRIGADSFLNGRLDLDVGAASSAIGSLLAAPLGFNGADGVDRVAQGLLDLATVAMTATIKEITIERGRDVRDYSLFVFGGGGPLFGSELARELGIPKVIVPPHPGAFSSLGMLMAEARLDFARTFLRPVTEAALTDARKEFESLQAEARLKIGRDFDVSRLAFEHEAELRYRGQKHAVRVHLPEPLTVESVIGAFEAAYKARYGRVHPELKVDLFVLRLGALIPMPSPDLAQVGTTAAAGQAGPARRRPVYFAAAGGRVATPVYRRHELPAGFELEGPAIIEEYSATTVIDPGDRMQVGRLGELNITCAVAATS
jgi:N-methylhydantoinase A